MLHSSNLVPHLASISIGFILTCDLRSFDCKSLHSKSNFNFSLSIVTLQLDVWTDTEDRELNENESERKKENYKKSRRHCGLERSFGRGQLRRRKTLMSNLKDRWELKWGFEHFFMCLWREGWKQKENYVLYLLY